MKRIALFLATNLAIVLVLSLSMRLLGVEPWLTSRGINMSGLLVFAAVMGFGGAFISLALSKWMAKRSTGARVIEVPANEAEAWLLNTVRRQAEVAGIGMPEVAIYDSPDVNAFATGMSRNKSLVAVSTGLLRNMTRAEAEAVLAHEVSHVANGDMVTLTLIQGVVNTFVIVLARLIGNFVDKVLLKNEEGTGPAFFITTIVAELVLGILASIIVMWFSRYREFRADAGGARLTSRQDMAAALRRLQRIHSEPLPEGMAALGIAGGDRMPGWR
ncbi:MAG TPA: protease HtpX, partial [Moraxellaceae bacterium]|nr:protease HtpX [Moraxellaceae bacterium]